MSRRTAKDILDSKKVKDNALTWDLKKPEVNAHSNKETFDISEIKIKPPQKAVKQSKEPRIMFLNTKAIISDEEIEKIKKSNMYNCLSNKTL